jgi:predicted Rossmann fold nucleotide-binding protein DprA/Smf involved in DNA uptake
MQQKVQQLSLESALVIPTKKAEKSIVDKWVPDERFSAIQKKIISACKVPSYFDVIIETTQLTSETVQSELFHLQLEGVVAQDFTGMWRSGDVYEK